MLLKEIEHFLEEDCAHEDYELIVPVTTTCNAEITVKEEGILAGLEEVLQIFDYAGLEYSSEFHDGDPLKAEDVVVRLYGSAAKILKVERLVLNILGRMSGIATLVREYVEEAQRGSSHVVVAGTRKTTPGFRKYEKRAIMLGGGDPHRFGLADAVIIKDNHLALMGLEQAIKKARSAISFTRKIEIEVETIEDALRAAKLGADIIMLDNMSPAKVRECLQLLNTAGLRDRLLIEASGGITQENVREYAATGVDVVSVGRLTYAARSLGFSLHVSEDRTETKPSVTPA
ncbi:MAG TPA: carboxylating nicotinate-nucleotide diphosphorylase [Methanomicrobia archaeon]|nr:carboxylating nicotinate-nucleotide diphosphorylase [Methanomicrobia archaeon]